MKFKSILKIKLAKFVLRVFGYDLAFLRSGLAGGFSGGRTGYLTGTHAWGVGFTMAEILLSLTIIGVVAAITLPSLTGNINERTWGTQRKALYARMSQAIALMPALNGYGNFAAATSSSDAVDTVAEAFVTSGLSKVLKINNICTNEHLKDCGLPAKINTLKGTVIDLPTNTNELNANIISNTYGSNLVLNTKAVGMETQNGESILVFYNPQCRYYMQEYDTTVAYSHFFMQQKYCVNFIYDFNGKKGPNTVGKDIGFMTVFYPTDSIVASPVVASTPATGKYKQSEAINTCSKQDSELRLPTSEELGSMFINQRLMNAEIATTNTDYWSARVGTSTLGWSQGFVSGGQWLHPRTGKYIVHCVKR